MSTKLKFIDDTELVFQNSKDVTITFSKDRINGLTVMINNLMFNMSSEQFDLFQDAFLVNDFSQFNFQMKTYYEDQTYNQDDTCGFKVTLDFHPIIVLGDDEMENGRLVIKMTQVNDYGYKEKAQIKLNQEQFEILKNFVGKNDEY